MRHPALRTHGPVATGRKSSTTAEEATEISGLRLAIMMKAFALGDAWAPLRRPGSGMPKRGPSSQLEISTAGSVRQSSGSGERRTSTSRRLLLRRGDPLRDAIDGLLLDTEIAVR